MLRQSFDTWHCGGFDINLARPRIMGVLNVTPDSFSDGGSFVDTEAAIAHGLDLLDAGADIIDVGGESTRPGFTPVDVQEEAERVVPVVRALVEAGACVSVDTRHAEVAKMCVRLGAAIINDVTGFTDPAMVEVAASCDAGLIVMHAGEVAARPPRHTVTLDTAPAAREAARLAAQAAPSAQTTSLVQAADKNSGSNDQLPGFVSATPAGSSRQEEARGAQGHTQSSAQAAASAQAVAPALDQVMRMGKMPASAPLPKGAGRRHFTLPESAPIMRNVMGFLGDQARMLLRAGIDKNRICLDPGPGFGKYADEDVVIQRATAKLASLGYPLLCAVSRKRFVGAVSGKKLAIERDAATAGVCIAALEAGARIVRVHNVEECAQVLDGYWAIAHPEERRAYVSLGSNVGDRVGFLARACALINDIPLTCVVGVSHAYETDPAYGIATPVANAVAEIRTELSPLVLMDALLNVEDELGRVRTPGQEGHGPRTIDCDLAWMEGERHAGRKLQLPHPGLGERDYVLVPMEDLMHDPARFLRHNGVDVRPEDERVGLVRADLGPVEWDN